MGYLPYCIGVIVVFCLCIEFGYGLQCYECNSHNDTRCGMEDLPDEFKKICDPRTKDGKHAYILCRKIKQMIDFEVNGLPADKRVIRSCGWDDSTHKNRCYQRSGFGGRQEVCACETDACNTANGLWSPLTAAVTLTVVFAKVLLH